MNFRFKKAWFRYLFSVILFLTGLKIVDICFWLIEKNDDYDLSLTEELTWREYMASQCQNDGIDWSVIQNELYDVYYDKVEYHPYRWFVPAPNYSGVYIQTDKEGFRKTKPFRQDTANYRIGFFGGSTAFSLYSKSGETLPELLQSKFEDSIRVINYGIGAYSSTTELICLAEVLRETDLDEAIFYDGVNEIGRYLESQQTEDFSYMSPNMGFPFADINIPIEKSLALREGFDRDEPWFGYVLKTIYPAINRYVKRSFKKTQGSQISSKDMAKEILEIYKHNKFQIVALCQAYGVKPVFVWQPHVYNTKKSLSEEENAIKDFSHTSMIKGISNELDQMVRRDSTICSITGVFNSNSSDPVFLDWHHLNRKGRIQVAEAIFQIRN